MNFEFELNQAITLLEIKDNISADSIKKAYRKLVKKYHPDLYPSKSKELMIAEQKMKKINEAKELIDNFIDIYGIDELITICSNSCIMQESSDISEKETIIYAKDAELVISETITDEFLKNSASQIYSIFSSSIGRLYSKQQHFVYVIENALKNLKCNGNIIATDRVTFYKGYSHTHEPLGRWYNTGRDNISHYYTSTLVNALNELNVDEGCMTSVNIESRKCGKKEKFFITKGKHTLCQLEKCDSYIEYLIKNDVVAFEKAQLYRGKTRSYHRNNGKEQFYTEDSVIDYYFVPKETDCSISEIKDLENGAEIQKRKIAKLDANNMQIVFQRKNYSNVIEQLNEIFVHHREVVPNSKRLGMIYFSFNGNSIIYTPAEITSDFLVKNNVSVGTFSEMFDMMVFISTVAQQLSSDFANKYINTYGKCHYHIGNDIISILTFHKSTKEAYSGIHIRFYHKTDNLCLYDLPNSNQQNDDLQTLKNLGPGIISKLKSIGINNSNELSNYSTEEVTKSLISANLYVDFITIYSIEGAKQGIKLSKISRERKQELSSFLKSNSC